MNRPLRIRAVLAAKALLAKMERGDVAKFQPGGIAYVVSIARAVSQEYYESLVEAGLLPATARLTPSPPKDS